MHQGLATAVPLVYFGSERLRFNLELRVRAEFAARGCCDLDERNPVPPCRIAQQERVDRLHTIKDAFGVVEAFDTDNQSRSFRQLELRDDTGSAFRGRW